jgi:hypothetical protein
LVLEKPVIRALVGHDVRLPRRPQESVADLAGCIAVACHGTGMTPPSIPTKLVTEVRNDQSSNFFWFQLHNLTPALRNRGPGTLTLERDVATHPVQADEGLLLLLSKVQVRV